MTIGRKLKEYLSDARVEYDLVEHARSEGSSHTAHAAHIPGDCLAKSVLLRDGDAYLLAVLPSTQLVDVDALGKVLGRSLDLASESDVERLFDDCMTGAIPPTGAAYDLQTVVDESLDGKPEIWFEGGDHRTLVHVDQSGFKRLMADARQAHFAC